MHRREILIAIINEVLSDQLESRALNLHEVFRNEYFLFSVWPFYDFKGNSKAKRNRLTEFGIHELSGAYGNILLDSGGFQLYRKDLDLNYLETLQIYKDAQLMKNDHAIALDFVTFPDDSPKVRLEKIKKNTQIFQKMIIKNKKIVPVIHGWSEKELTLASKQLDYGNEFLAFGSGFPMITIQKGKNLPIKDMIMKRFIDFLKVIKKQKLDEHRIHVLGASGQNSSHLCWYAGIDQTDSSSWRIKAAYGKIALIGVSEAKVSNVKSSFGVKAWKPKHDQLLKDCECPVCKHLSLPQKKEILGQGKSIGFNNRCIHNAYVYLQERELAREMVGTPKYRTYLEKRFKRTWWLKFLNKIDEGSHQKSLDHYLKSKY
ncbi:hypothetical protein [Candidatus Lokiarchaeum ossiferum]|uniref:hypothetical protein n=1 Tax=Candidatus Lokiarchaeum ossiferum TaxID=2951803 RepID=UPI00352D1B68